MIYETASRGADPIASALAALVCALVAGTLVWITVWKKRWSVCTAPTYAVLEGLFLGTVSAALERRYPGIAIEAVGITVSICLFMFFAYRTGLVRVSERFRKGLVLALWGIGVFYLVRLALTFYGLRALPMFAGGVPGLFLNAVIVVIAALTLIAAFDAVEQCARSGLPKYMEWYAAFGLILALVWLYVEVLNLLSKAERSKETGQPA